jgi:hypothetical protein
MEDLETEYKELKKKNKALRHHLKEEAATVQKQAQDITELKLSLQQKTEKVEQMQLDNTRLTKRIQLL